MMTTEQLKAWQLEFGDEYTERNIPDWRTRFSAWKTMIGDLQLENVVEVGCNRGHNLQAIAELGCVSGDIVGIEPNRKALIAARTRSSKFAVLLGHAFDLPFVDNYADLVFTSGVLIHVALDDLSIAIDEIYRVSKRYILCVEYFAEEETLIPYRGHDNLLWKRDFEMHYLERHPDLVVIKNGSWQAKDGFDRTHWRLFQKQS